MFVVVRLRGNVGIEDDKSRTLKMLNLKAKFNSTLVPETETYKGMLGKVKSSITWGEINKDTLTLLLKKRIRRNNSSKNFLKDKGYKSFPSFSKDMIKGKINPTELGIKYFRLTPPSKGFKKNLKVEYPKGEAGYRGKAINKLLKRMV